MTMSGIAHQTAETPVRRSRLSESEEDTQAQQKTEPIRIKLTRKRAPAKKAPAKKEAKREQLTAKVVHVGREVTQEQVLGTRLKLDAALEHAGKLFDLLVDNERQREINEFNVFHRLCLRNIVLEKLAKELNARNVLPVTIMTLSKLFAQSFTTYVG